MDPVQLFDCVGIINIILWLLTVINYVTGLLQTIIDKLSVGLIGKPVPIIVAWIPPPGLVWAGLNDVTVIGIFYDKTAVLIAKPNLLIWTSGFLVPAGKATELSKLIGKEQVKLRIDPVKLRQFTYNIVTVISDKIILFEEG